MNGGISSQFFTAFKRGFAIWTIALLCFAGGAGYAKPASAQGASDFVMDKRSQAATAIVAPDLYKQNQQAEAQAKAAEANKSKSSAVGTFVGDALTFLFGIVRTILTFIFNQFAWVLFLVIEYNGFINAAPVVTGWLVVRDFTNMLFIMILLVIAFAILFGREEYGSAKDLPGLFVMAILINFSRMLIGFMIDIAQVFLLTFSRAFTSGAGSGNLVKIFSVGAAVEPTTDLGKFGDAVGAVTIAEIASVVILAMATVIVGYLAVAMVIRVVVLWLLIVLAPLAWFMRIVPKLGHDVYSKWWSEFKSQLLMGPVMAFFLWLSLATVAGGANEVANSKGTAPDISYAPLQSATAANTLKAIIAVVMLMKGLEISTSLGGVGSKTLAGAAGMSKRVARGVVGGTLAMQGALVGYGAGKLTRGGAGILAPGGAIAKAPSLPGLALTSAGKAAGRLGLGTAAVALTAAGGKMTDTEEKRWKSRVSDVTAGGDKDLAHIQRSNLEAKAAAGGGFDLSRLNAEEKIQLKELTKGVEKEPKMWEKMKDPAEVDRYFQARAAIDADVKDPKARREAEHHSEEMAVENLHRMSSGEQTRLLGHAPSDMISSKLPVEAITGANVGNIGTLATGNAEALAKLMNKSPEAMESVLENGSSDNVRAALKTKLVKEEGLSEAILKNSGVPSENITIAISNLSTADRGDLRGKQNRRQAAMPRLEDALSRNAATMDAHVPSQSRENMVANLELHAMRSAEALESGAALNTVNLADTLGLARGTGNFTSPEARANFKQIISDPGLGADFLLTLEDADIQGELAQELAANLQAGAVAEIAKRIFDGKIQKNDRITSLYERLDTLPAPAGGGKSLSQRMSKNKNIGAQLG